MEGQEIQKRQKVDGEENLTLQQLLYQLEFNTGTAFAFAGQGNWDGFVKYAPVSDWPRLLSMFEIHQMEIPKPVLESLSRKMEELKEANDPIVNYIQDRYSKILNQYQTLSFQQQLENVQ